MQKTTLVVALSANGIWKIDMIIAQENTLLFYIFLISATLISLYLGYAKSKSVKLTILAPIFALFFSHFCYSLVNIESLVYDGEVYKLFTFWQKGYMIYGGIIGIVICAYLFYGKKAPLYIDFFAAPMMLFIAIFRIAEGFLGQGYGEYWEGDTSLFTRFPFMIYDADYELWAWAIFMLEALVAIAIFIIILKTKPYFKGDKFTLALSLYAAAQIILESLRRDEFLRFGFVRIEQVLSAVAVLIAIIIYSNKKEMLRNLLLYAIFIASAILMEFAMEGRVELLLFLSESACYIVLAIISLLCALLVTYSRHSQKLTIKRSKDSV